MTFEIKPEDTEPTDEDFGALDVSSEEVDALLSDVAGAVDVTKLPKGLLEKLAPLVELQREWARRHEPFASAVSFKCSDEPGSTRRRDWLVFPQNLFRGDGLWLWGADATTRIHAIKCGNQNCFLLNHGGIPGLYFEAGMSFTDFEQLLATPQSNWSHARLRELPLIPAHQRIRMNTAEIGNSLLLDVEGPLTHAVMWGKTVD